MIILLDAELKKILWQNPKPLHDKGLGEIRDTRSISKHKKAIYDKPTANIKLNEEKLRSNFTKTQKKTRLSIFFSYLFSIVLEVLATAIRQQKEIKGKQSGKEEVKLWVFSDNILNWLQKINEGTPIADKYLQ